MADRSAQSRAAWGLAVRQHGVVARRQLLDLGFGAKAIAHRIAVGRLHIVRRGVYAVGRSQLSSHGHWMAAVLACGPDAALSHGSAATAWGIAGKRPGVIEISVPAARAPRGGSDLHVHRRTLTPDQITTHHRIPLTVPIRTLLDLASELTLAELEAAINEVDRRDLVDPETLRSALDSHSGERGVARLRSVLDRATFTLTESELERRFLPLARRAGLALPRTAVWLNGFKVDFYWPALGLVVETDGLRYHRTAAQQTRDRRRDQAHAAAGLTTLRFSHAQVVHERDHVCATLAAVARRLT